MHAQHGYRLGDTCKYSASYNVVMVVMVMLILLHVG